MEPRDRPQEAAGARWSAGTSVKKSEVATETASGEETVMLDEFRWRWQMVGPNRLSRLSKTVQIRFVGLLTFDLFRR
jgi:hypothetical protein